mmetsp:Transcript_14490/g.30493  ORF Transcript_14490/g.30493 Transcript_14490/m.30493 type:complete len:779 (-) Transcript_14490:229-2565(-)|eukprot:CAMPEP_0171346604 /NCGR_PEP_ID=MMETSP0878-20121228/25309_1 /TAXON_ID=67004 /ORGANISM="Thalassiosira weissflogii, Strain CCMP1336" /LENGTH=778 /DNA_ID=CAMNT_0011850339 /DNA_START=141 /DNA_END=2477 /DNA_ORIENTATION=+
MKLKTAILSTAAALLPLAGATTSSAASTASSRQFSHYHSIDSLTLLRGGDGSSTDNHFHAKRNKHSNKNWTPSSLFGRKKSPSQSDAKVKGNESGNENSRDAIHSGAGPAEGQNNKSATTSSFEITMNASPDGKRNISVNLDEESEAKVQEFVDSTLNELENQIKSGEGLLKQQLYDQSRQQGSNTAKVLSGGGSDDENETKNNRNINNDINNANGKDKSTQSTTIFRSNSNPKQTTHISANFPISPQELPHFLTMSFLMFLFIYVFTTVRDTKDTLVVSNCGAEAIPFLKLYGVMPAATAFIVMYSKLSNMVGKQTLFYLTLVPFFVFYAVFAFVLFPNRDVIHFPNLAEGLVGGKGGAIAAAVNLLRYWSFSLYFIVSELWASAGVPLLFWQCANDVTPMAQAKRFYPLFAVTGNLAPIVSGKIMSFVISLQKNNDDAGFGTTLQTLAVIKGLVCFGIITLYRHVYAMAEEREKKERMEQSLSTIRGIERTGKVEITMKFEKKKEKLTLRQSAKELMKSRELKAMAMMVFCYNVCVELTEVLWKGILRKTFPNKSMYMDYMARFSQTVGVVAFLLQLVASEIINVFGWKWTAMIPPVTMGVLAMAFFAAVIAGEEKIPLAQALLIGTVQNVANKVTKYSLFDPCKEMAYIPLGPDAKVKGKAAVDVLGARLGRSIGAASQQLLVLLVGGGSILNCTPYIGALYLAAIAIWSNAVSVLGQLFESSEDKIKKVDNTPKLESIGQAITIIKSIEDRKREKKQNGGTGNSSDAKGRKPKA